MRARRAAIYARVSTLDQQPENQLAELRQDVGAMGWTAVEYCDHGISGGKERRPALDRRRRRRRTWAPAEPVSVRRPAPTRAWRWSRSPGNKLCDRCLGRSRRLLARALLCDDCPSRL